MDEVSSVLRMLDEAYKVFGLTYKMALSTRPEGYLGELELWNKAEAALTDALNATGLPWEVLEHDSLHSHAPQLSNAALAFGTWHGVAVRLGR
jgi:threonyl-tRNA synthetase